MGRAMLVVAAVLALATVVAVAMLAWCLNSFAAAAARAAQQHPEAVDILVQVYTAADAFERFAIMVLCLAVATLIALVATIRGRR